MTSEQRIVSFDLMPQDPDYYFVLTEALGDFAARTRAEVEDGSAPESHLKWAETAEAALDRIEEALSTHATIGDVVADSIEQQSAYRNELRHLPGYMSAETSAPGRGRSRP
jgi:hypothetical protein